MKNYKILAEFVKDVSSETKDVQTYLFVKDHISKYQLTIDITSQPTKNKLIEVSTILKFEDKEDNEKKSYFELVYVSIVKLDESVKEKKEIQKIIMKKIVVSEKITAWYIKKITSIVLLLLEMVKKKQNQMPPLL